MKIGKKNKKVEEEVVELKKVEEEPTEPILEDAEGGDIGLVEEVVIEPTDDIPEDAKVVEEVVIEPVDEIKEPEEEPKEEEFRFGDKVIMKMARDYDGRRIDVDIFDPYTVYAIEGDKVQLRKGHLIIFTKLSNIKKIK